MTPATAQINTATGLVTVSNVPIDYSSTILVRAQDSGGFVDTADIKLSRAPAAISCSIPTQNINDSQNVSVNVTVQNARGIWTAAKVTGDSRISVSSTGRVTSSGLPVGTYNYSVRVTRAFDNSSSTCSGRIVVTATTVTPTLSCSVSNQSGTEFTGGSTNVSITGGEAPLFCFSFFQSFWTPHSN